jgi:hypothetical protein
VAGSIPAGAEAVAGFLVHEAERGVGASTIGRWVAARANREFEPYRPVGPTSALANLQRSVDELRVQISNCGFLPVDDCRAWWRASSPRRKTLKKIAVRIGSPLFDTLQASTWKAAVSSRNEGRSE